MSNKYDNFFLYEKADIIIQLNNILSSYKIPISEKDVIDLKEINIRESRYIVKMLLKECKSYILNKKSCLNSTFGFDVYIIRILIRKIPKLIMNLDINKLSIMDYIQIGCIIDYDIFNKEIDNFKNIIRKEKIKEINNE